MNTYLYILYILYILYMQLLFYFFKMGKKSKWTRFLPLLQHHPHSSPWLVYDKQMNSFMYGPYDAL